jgi:S-(hydroxymethyl)glutathione dehydrogenase/alcohol dehydrogenase
MTGAGVRSVLPGDNVVLHWRKGKGIESQVPTYTIDGGKVNAGWITTFNEWGIISENRLTVIPKDIDLQIAALFGCAVTTGFGVIVNNVRVRIGESLVIFGAGGVGLNIVQAARLAGAHPIIAVDLYDNRLDLARRMGATHVINSQTLDAEKEILGALSGRPLDCFIDNTGNPASIQLGYRITGPKGRVGLVGVPRKGDDITIYSLPLHFGKILTGSHGGEAMPTEDIPRYISLLLAGRLSLSELITNVYQLSDINLAIDDMRNGRTAGRTLVDLGE